MPFSIEENYPLLIDTLYETWPSEDDEGFINRIADKILQRVEREKLNSHDLG